MEQGSPENYRLSGVHAVALMMALLLAVSLTLAGKPAAGQLALDTLCAPSGKPLPAAARVLRLGEQLPWQPVAGQRVHAAIGETACWVRLRYQLGEQPDHSRALVVIDNPRISLVRFYSVDAHKRAQHYRAGADLSFDAKPLGGPYPAFTLSADDSGAGTAYLALTANNAIQFSASLTDHAGYQARALALVARQSALSGALLLSAAWLLLLFLAHRDSLLLYLGLWLGAASLASFNLSGLGHMLLWPGSPPLNQYLYLVLLPLLTMLSALAARDFMTRHAPELSVLPFNLANRSAFALLLATPFLPRALLMPLDCVLLLGTLLLLATIGLRHPHVRVRGLGAAALVLMTSFGLWCLAAVGVLTLHAFWHWQLQASVLAIALLMALMVMVPNRRQGQSEVETGHAGARAEDRALQTARSQFLTSLSHQLRTPLNGILGMADLLRRDKHLPMAGQQQADTIFQAATALVNTVNDMLDYSAIQQGTLTLKQLPVQPDDLLSDVVELFAVASRRKDVPILCFIDSRVPAEIITDEMRVKQVLSNLLSNALRHTDSGRIEISISTRELHNQQGKAVLNIEVSDTGSGMDAAALEAQLAGPSGSKSGLTVSRQLVRLLGGELTFSGSAGLGATFCFTLPVQFRESGPLCLAGRHVTVVTESAALRLSLSQLLHRWGTHCQDIPLADMASPPPVPENGALVLDAASFHALDTLADCRWPDVPVVVIGDPGDDLEGRSEQISTVTLPLKPRTLKRTLAKRLDSVAPTQGDTAAHASAAYTQSVLVVDDDQVSQLVIASLLRSLGIEAVTVGDGETALDALARQPFDVVFLDWEMPGMHGAELTRAIRSNGPEQTPWIICLTAHGEDAVVQQAREAGVDDLLHKPVNRQQVRVALRRAMHPAGAR